MSRARALRHLSASVQPAGNRPPSGLLVDLYQLTMGESYVAEGRSEHEATFSLFFRTLPHGWGYALACGLEDALRYLEELRFDDDDLAYLEETGLFGERFLERLRSFRFTGSVRALAEGTAVFRHEPLLEVTAPLVEAQVVETMVLNEVHLQTLVASKAGRCVDAADGRTLVDFSLRRTHGGEAGMKVARASYAAGFDATSNVLAGRIYGIPIAGTMAHSYVESFVDELEAFRAYVRSYPDSAILLVDTYSTLDGARKAVVVAQELAEAGHRLQGVRLDSGDLVTLSKGVRAILDEAGFADATVFASGGLDESEIARLVSADAPIGGFGVGTRMATSADSPFLDMAYKLVDVDGRPVLKSSEGKATLPGAKQVWRVRRSGAAVHDLLALNDVYGDGEPLLREVMRDGRATRSESLEEIRGRARHQRESLPERVRALDGGHYDVRVDATLEALGKRLTSEFGKRPT
ncbi:MAG TPA: nicotinate phosphoribosyltransferase [Gaiellaceae bacterium]|nr:nicotinate phosphoribosyltransferase [Gaiellaceae bacterium]